LSKYSQNKLTNRIRGRMTPLGRLIKRCLSCHLFIRSIGEVRFRFSIIRNCNSICCNKGNLYWVKP